MQHGKLRLKVHDGVIVGNNPLMGVDHSGTEPINPFTGQPNSILHCQVDAHWDHTENLIGGVVIGGALITEYIPLLMVS
jgi:hypothetical protein